MATGFRGTGENGSLQRKADVDQLPEYATGANASVELYEKLVPSAGSTVLLYVMITPIASS